MIQLKIKPKNIRLKTDLTFSRAQLAVFVLAFGVIGWLIFRSFAATPAKTYYVNVNSSASADTNSGSQSQPFKTITKAASVATSGDTVLVEPGVYHEQVTISTNNNGVTFRGDGATRPIVDGDNTRSVVFYLVNGVHDVTIDNFEIRNVTAGGTGRSAGILSYNTHNDTIENNDIHDSHATNLYSYGIVLGTNDNPRIVHDVLIKNNLIHDIGPGGESMGIWLIYTQNMTVDSNQMYMVRKEGVRDWVGLNNTVTNNRAFLNWNGIDIQTSNHDYVANNYSYDNVYGFTQKHNAGKDSGTSTCPIQPDTYDKDANGNIIKSDWTRIWHNTSYNNTGAGIAIGESAPRSDYVDVEDNIFAGNGNDNVHYWPDTTCGHIVLDHNVYSKNPAGVNRPSYDYSESWNDPATNRMATVGDIAGLTYQASDNWGPAFTVGQPLNYEKNGQDFNMTFNDPDKGDLDYSTAPTKAGANLGDKYGAQLGARSLPPPAVTWTQYPMTAIASSYFSGGAARTTDNVMRTYWWSSGAPSPKNNQWITYDFGQPRTFQQLVLGVYGQYDTRNTKTYKFEVSNDNVNYTTILSGVNPDSEQSSFKYDLAQPVTARYIKYTMVDNFGGAYMIFTDLAAGMLNKYIPPSPPPSQPSALFGTTAVGISHGIFYTDRSYVNHYTTTSAYDVSKLEFYADGLGSAASGTAKFKGVIYAADASGNPTSLLATSAEIAVNKGEAGAWRDLTFSTPIHLNQGTYYIGVISGGTTGVARDATASSTGIMRSGADTYSNGAANPYGTATAGNTKMSLYAVGAVTAPLFGATTLGTNHGTFVTDRSYVNHYTITSAYDVSDLAFYVDGLGSAASGTARFKGVIYAADSSGNPTSLLATSAEITVTKGDAATWRYLIFSSPLHLNPGNYYIGVISGGTGYVARDAYVTSTGIMHSTTDSYADGPASPFAAATVGNVKMSLYAVGAAST